MASQSSIMEKTNTFLNEMIHITHGWTMHFHGRRNKMVPLMKPSILVDFTNGVKFCSYTYWLINDIWSYRFSHQVSNQHISNKDLVLSSHVKIGSKWNSDMRAYHCFFHTVCPLSWARAYMTSQMASCLAIHWPPNEQWIKCVLDASNLCPHSHVKKLDAKGWIKPKQKTQCWGESKTWDVKGTDRWFNKQP